MHSSWMPEAIFESTYQRLELVADLVVAGVRTLIFLAAVATALLIFARTSSAFPEVGLFGFPAARARLLSGKKAMVIVSLAALCLWILVFAKGWAPSEELSAVAAALWVVILLSASWRVGIDASINATPDQRRRAVHRYAVVCVAMWVVAAISSALAVRSGTSVEEILLGSLAFQVMMAVALITACSNWIAAWRASRIRG